MRNQNPWLITFERRPNALFRVLCFHCAGASAALYRHWTEGLVDDCELVAVQLPGRGNRYREPPLTSVQEVTAHLAHAMEPLLQKPFMFFGHSAGALLAYELACELRNLAYPLPTALFASARRAPHLPSPAPNLHQLNDDEFIAKLHTFEGIDEEATGSQELMQLLLPTFRADFAMSEQYEYRPRAPLPCALVAMGGRQDRWVPESSLRAWADMTHGRFHHRMFEGGHFYLNDARRQIIGEINECIAEHFVTAVEGRSADQLVG